MKKKFFSSFRSEIVLKISKFKNALTSEIFYFFSSKLIIIIIFFILEITSRYYFEPFFACFFEIFTSQKIITYSVLHISNYFLLYFKILISRKIFLTTLYKIFLLTISLGDPIKFYFLFSFILLVIKKNILIGTS